MSRDDDNVRIPSNRATLPLALIKIPASLANNAAWSAAFAEPGRVVGTLSGELAAGAALTVTVGNREIKYTVALKDHHVKSRLVSVDVGDAGGNPRFEGVVTRMGTLNPASLKDATYLASLRQSVAVDSTRTKVVQSLKQKEIEAMSTAAAVAVAAPRVPSDDEDGSDDDGGDDGPAGDKKAAAASKAPKASKKKSKDVNADEIRRRVFECFSRVDPETSSRRAFWKRGDLRKTTGVPLHKLGPILDEICIYHDKGSHQKYFSLKPEFTLQ